MPKYEKIRNKLIRDAQKSALKPSKLWLVLNSGIFLWFLSASFLTVGGGYVANHQGCMREADQLIERQDRMSREMYSRRAAFNETVADAKTVDNLILVPTTKGSLYPDLEKMPYYELEHEIRKLRFRIDYDDLLDVEVTRTREEMRRMMSEFVDKSDHFQGPIKTKNPSKADLDKFLQMRKLVSQLLAEHTDFEQTFETFVFLHQPDCTIVKTLETALGNRPAIVRAAVNHNYVLSDFATPMRHSMERAKDLQRQIMTYK
jgi:hypothetical protein